MRQITILGLLLLLAGCQNTVGPFAARPPLRVDDPRLSIQEQEMRGRDRWALPLDSSLVAPQAGTPALGK